MVKIIFKTLLLFCILILIPYKAFANAGIPMIALFIPAFGISLIPIIAIEVLYLSKKLKLTPTHAAKTATSSNLVSTLAGVPLTWLLLVIIQMISGGGGAFNINTVSGKFLSVTLQAPWVVPHENQMHWIVPAAGLFLLIPFFFVSWWSEYLVSKKMIKDCPVKEIKTTVRNANVITYSLLILWPLGLLLIK